MKRTSIQLDNGLQHLLVALILSAGLRLLNLGSKSLWFDEANSLRVSALSLNAFWQGNTETFHPPFYYLILNSWTALGTSEFVLRLLSFIATLIGVAMTFYVARLLMDTPSAVTATYLTAVSPLITWYAQEARPYAFLLLLNLITTLAFIKLMQTSRIGWWFMYVGAMTVALYTHYTSVLVIGVQLILGVILLDTQRTRWINIGMYTAAWAAILLAYLPWLRSPAFQNFLLFAGTTDNYALQLFAERLNMPLKTALTILALGLPLLFAGGLGLLYSLIRRRHHWAGLYEAKGLLWGCVGVILLIFVAAVVPRAYSLKRQIVPLWPFLLIGFGYLWPWRRSTRPIVSLVLTAAVAASLVNIWLVPKDEWREATQYIQQNQRSDDVVVSLPSYMSVPINYYNTSGFAYQRVQAQNLEETLVSLAQTHGRIWYAVHTVDKTGPQQTTKTWLDRHALLVDSVHFYHIDLYLYEVEASV